jgi:hypothetical protein
MCWTPHEEGLAMTSSTHPAATEEHRVEDVPLIDPTAAPPTTAAPMAAVERQSPLKRLLAAFGIGRIR